MKIEQQDLWIETEWVSQTGPDGSDMEAKGVRVTHAQTGVYAVCAAALTEEGNKSIATDMVTYGVFKLMQQ